jgi:hypothetical protein
MMNASNIQPGSKHSVKLNGEVVIATFVKVSENPKYGLFEYNGRQVARSFDRVEPAAAAALVQTASTDGQLSTVSAGVTTALATPVLPTFNVNTRFHFIESMVDMIVRDQEKSLIVTGSGGLGKSYTVFNRLKLNDLGTADYEKVSGHMTPKALYRRLHDNNGKVSVFDDCDSVLMNDTSINLLKAALDSYGQRTLSWCSEMGSSEDLPNRFDFTGRVIFISNFSLVDIPQPVVSRALYVDVTMTPEEKIERIKAIAPALVPDMAPEEREECIELLDKLRSMISDLNLRTMLKVASIRKANPNDWRDMASYMITARLSRPGR